MKSLCGGVRKAKVVKESSSSSGFVEGEWEGRLRTGFVVVVGKDFPGVLVVGDGRLEEKSKKGRRNGRTLSKTTRSVESLSLLAVVGDERRRDSNEAGYGGENVLKVLFHSVKNLFAVRRVEGSFNVNKGKVEVVGLVSRPVFDWLVVVVIVVVVVVVRVDDPSDCLSKSVASSSDTSSTLDRV